ncbi:MAG: SDR family oxidoreductase [Micrococcales bacterium]
MNYKVALKGSRVLITGGASGLGRQLAVQSAAKGAEVVIWDMNQDEAKKVVDEITKAGGVATAHRVDITDRDSVNRLALEVGAVDVLFNNAGVVSGDWFLDLDPTSIERTYKVNVLALYWMTQAFLPAMVQKNQGCVVTISSASGLLGVAKLTDYAASKFAAFGFMESLRSELRMKKSSVNTLTVCPHYIGTGMFDGVQTKFPWLLPILDEAKVAAKILSSVEKGKAQLVLPKFVNVIPVTRMLPVRAFDRVTDFFGVNRTMDHFRGRNR